jgi:excinuclease ABC subunit A
MRPIVLRRAGLKGAEATIATELLKEIRSRLRFLRDVGLGYLTLDRPAPSLSGGEGQRIRLASQIGSELTGVIYVLDEPSIGLHQRDNRKLLSALSTCATSATPWWSSSTTARRWRRPTGSSTSGPAPGATAARWWPRARPPRSCAEAASPALPARRARDRVPAQRRRGDGRKITVVGARENNLKDVDRRLPARPVRLRDRGERRGQEHAREPDPLPRGGARAARQRRPVGAHDKVDGPAEIDKVIDIDQSPIGRTPRSNPATYTKLFDLIRDFFALLPEARMHGYTPGASPST